MLESFLRQLLNLPDRDRAELLTLFQPLMTDPEFKVLMKSIARITDDSGVPAFTRVNTIHRIGRYAKAAAIHSRIDAQRQHLPIVSEYMIIKVNFAGLGSELDDLHYGIVWNADRKRDHISVIPTTSFKPGSTIETGETFNIGRVGFLQGETVVLMNQIASVSRKRIPTPRHYNAGSQATEVVSLSPDQQQRIQDGFRVYGLKEKTLYTRYLRDSFTDTLPELEDPVAQYSHLIRPVIEISNTKQELVYRLYDNPAEYRIIRKPCVLQGLTRQNILKSWAEATADVDPTSKAVRKTREDVRSDAYAVIQAAIAAAQPAEEPPLQAGDAN